MDRAEQSIGFDVSDLSVFKGEAQGLILEVCRMKAALVKSNYVNSSQPPDHQVVQPIYQRSKYRWKRYEQQLSDVMPLLQPFIDNWIVVSFLTLPLTPPSVPHREAGHVGDICP
jgi:hypothetical protein